MGLSAGRKCKPVISRMFGCRQFCFDLPRLEISFVIVGSRGFKVMVEIGGVCFWMGPNIANRSHQCRSTNWKAVYLVGKISIGDSGCRYGREAHHAMRPLDIRNSCREQLADPADVRGYIIDRLLLLVHLGKGYTSQKDPQYKHCCKRFHPSLVSLSLRWGLSARRNGILPATELPFYRWTTKLAVSAACED